MARYLANTRTSGKNSKGFTLVELSIVIVIVGLIVAGVVAGNGLVKQAKLFSIIKEMNEVISISQTFKLQYNYFPGDLPTASSYWGANCAATATDCNGNGNGKIEWNPPGGGCANRQEQLRGWQHLQLAGLLRGNFTGVCSGSGWDTTNTYVSRYDKLSTYTFSPGGSKNNNSVNLSKGGVANFLGDWDPILIPKDAMAIDTKIDDAAPVTGIFRSWVGTAPAGTCSTGNAYVLTETIARCVLSRDLQ